MDQQPENPTSGGATSSAETPQAQAQAQPPPPPQQQQPASSLTTPVPASPNPKPALNQTPRPSPPSNPQHYGARPPSFPRNPWPASQPRGGMAIGVPASSQSSPFSSSYGQQFGGLGRPGVNVSEPISNSAVSQTRPGMQGMQGAGMMGSLGSVSSPRPTSVPVHHPQRSVQSSLRPPSSSSNQPSVSPNFQGHGLLRNPSLGSPSPNASQTMSSHNHQPWLQTVSQGKLKPPLPPPAYRSPMNPPALQQRSHIQQQHHQTLSASSPHQHVASTQQQQQPSPSTQSQEHYGQQFPPSRFPQSLPHQQQIARGQGLGSQRPSSPPMLQPSTTQFEPQSRTLNAESDESSNRILSKRSIHELVSQIDPSEKLGAEVEDILIDIAEDFVESITTFGCSLAKHRKSSSLEAKDILIHLERNWNITLPGFSGDEIKSYRKPLTNDVHKERLAAIRKSIMATETANTKNPTGQVAGTAKSNLSKTPASAMGT